MFKSNKGITLVSLVITVLLIIMLAGVSMNMGFSTVNDMRIGRIISNMKLVCAKVELVEEDRSFSNQDINLGNGPYQIENSGKLDEITISQEEIEMIAENAKVSDDEVLSWNWYKWSREELGHQNLAEDMLAENEYFYVNYEHAEILYSIGTSDGSNQYYSMTGLQNIV